MKCRKMSCVAVLLVHVSCMSVELYSEILEIYLELVVWLYKLSYHYSLA